jgi:SAM-dependent methyltransferase
MTSIPWHDDDVFWEAVAPFLFPDSRWGEAARREVDQVVALTGVEPRAHILDLCCGPRRDRLELARRGYSVTGVDRTIAYLDQASHQAASEGLSVDFVRGDMLTFRRPGAFDVAISLFTSFGYFESDADEQTVMQNLFQSLKPGGRFSLRTAFAVMTVVAIACGTYSLLGPPFIRTYREAMQWHYMPNLDWWGATLCELYAARIWVGYHKWRARR